MKTIFKIIGFFIFCHLTLADNVIFMSSQRPEDVKNIQEYLPQIQTDIRYYSEHNFVGRPIAGYKAPVCLLTLKAINALEKVEHELLLRGLTLKVYDENGDEFSNKMD